MKKQFFLNHAKSSALLVSAGIHALLIMVALSFVAVTVITKKDQQFEAKPIERPRMKMQKLQVPVNVKKTKVRQPKLRKRIVVKPKFNQTVPDIKMPEISGVTGGIGAGYGGGLGGAAGIGFTMPEIEIFGVKGKGEKIVLILDTSKSMLKDEMGGIPAYKIIKEEMLRIIDSLPPMAVFNIIVFGGNSDLWALFPSLESASKPNKVKARTWLEPLNMAGNAARTGNFGTKTLGPGGVDMEGDYRIGKFATPIKKGGPVYAGKDSESAIRDWYDAVMLAMKQQADTIFLLSESGWSQRVAVEYVMSQGEWIKTTSDGQKWAENAKKAKEMLEEENRKRKAAGKPPKVIYNSSYALNAEYFPDSPRPPFPKCYYYTPEDAIKAFVAMKDKHRPTQDMQNKGKIDFTFNMVHFSKQGKTPGGKSTEAVKKIIQFSDGDYQTVKGLEEIESFVK